MFSFGFIVVTLLILNFFQIDNRPIQTLYWGNFDIILLLVNKLNMLNIRFPSCNQKYCIIAKNQVLNRMPSLAPSFQQVTTLQPKFASVLPIHQSFIYKIWYILIVQELKNIALQMRKQRNSFNFQYNLVYNIQSVVFSELAFLSTLIQDFGTTLLKFSILRLIDPIYFDQSNKGVEIYVQILLKKARSVSKKNFEAFFKSLKILRASSKIYIDSGSTKRILDNNKERLKTYLAQSQQITKICIQLQICYEQERIFDECGQGIRFYLRSMKGTPIIQKIYKLKFLSLDLTILYDRINRKILNQRYMIKDLGTCYNCIKAKPEPRYQRQCTPAYIPDLKVYIKKCTFPSVQHKQHYKQQLEQSILT